MAKTVCYEEYCFDDNQNKKDTEEQNCNKDFPKISLLIVASFFFLLLVLGILDGSFLENAGNYIDYLP